LRVYCSRLRLPKMLMSRDGSQSGAPQAGEQLKPGTSFALKDEDSDHGFGSITHDPNDLATHPESLRQIGV
jgi:hypothetical protein